MGDGRVSNRLKKERDTGMEKIQANERCAQIRAVSLGEAAKPMADSVKNTCRFRQRRAEDVGGVTS